MQLPGRLRSTTVGDLLGVLHRARASGTLELEEDRGRCHRVHLSAGLVVAVELDGAAASLAEVLRREKAVEDDILRRSLLRALAARRLHGDVLVRDFRINPEVVSRGLRAQAVSRLRGLEQITDAQVRFRVAVRAPRGAMSDSPLGPREFLAGRRRARDARGESPRPRPAPTELGAWRVLGVPPGSCQEDVKRAFRRLARAYHPDLHPGATEEERRQLSLRFAEVNAAYRAIVS